MPGKNIVKEYRPESFYHIYNRGVAKQEIFLDEYDYKKFLGYLKLYLTPINIDDKTAKVFSSRQLKNYCDVIKLISYCLMPNHFHLLLYQKEIDSINYFMRSLGTKFSMYFNRKYKRVGPVFQGTYKAVEVKSESQLTYLSKYIHRNPLPVLEKDGDLENYKYSSYANYLGRFKQAWVKPADILCYFKKSLYKDFVEEVDARDLYLIKDVVIENP
ncbi:MAG: transposase [Patescibacteria group bacterium]|nr:transposase [Patescibacteria group bacterium]